MVAQQSASPSLARFQVRLLGPFSVARNGVSLDAPQWQPRVGQLFRLLASTPGCRRPRDEVIELLWPEASPDAGGANLRLLCHRLRLALGVHDPPSVLLVRGWVELNPAYQWDVDLHCFENNLSTATDTEALEVALQLYGGEPLADERYEDWATPVRDRVQHHWRDLCLRLAERYETDCTWDHAAGWYQQVLIADPLDEVVLQRLLIALSRSGRRAEALRTYQRFRQELEDEIGVDPLPETQELVDELWTQTPAPAELSLGSSTRRLSSTKPSVPPATAAPAGQLVVKELTDTLSALVVPSPVDASLSAPRVILLVIDAGTGETVLLSDITQLTRMQGMLPPRGEDYEGEIQLRDCPARDVAVNGIGLETETVPQSPHR